MCKTVYTYLRKAVRTSIYKTVYSSVNKAVYAFLNKTVHTSTCQAVKSPFWKYYPKFLLPLALLYYLFPCDGAVAWEVNATWPRRQAWTSQKPTYIKLKKSCTLQMGKRWRSEPVSTGKLNFNSELDFYFIYHTIHC